MADVAGDVAMAKRNGEKRKIKPPVVDGKWAEPTELVRTAKVLLRPDERGRRILLETARRCIALKDAVSEHIVRKYVLDDDHRDWKPGQRLPAELLLKVRLPSYEELNAELYYAFRERFGTKSQMTQSAMRKVVGNFRAIKEQAKARVETRKAEDAKSAAKHRDRMARWEASGRKGAEPVLHPKKPIEWTPPRYRHASFDLDNYGHAWGLDNGDVLSLTVCDLDERLLVPYDRKGREDLLPERPRDEGVLESLPHWFGAVAVTIRRKRIYACIPCRRMVSTVSASDGPVVVGVDLGMNRPIVANGVTKDGVERTIFLGNRERDLSVVPGIGGMKVPLGADMCERRAEGVERRKSLQKKGTKGSLRRIKYDENRESRYADDVNRRLAKALVLDAIHVFGSNVCIVLEDLADLRERFAVVRKRDRATYVSWPYHRLRQCIEHFALKHGVPVQTVDPAYTSRTCPHCGKEGTRHREKPLRHRFHCPRCGRWYDADYVGARNIRRRGEEAVILRAAVEAAKREKARKRAEEAKSQGSDVAVSHAPMGKDAIGKGKKGRRDASSTLKKSAVGHDPDVPGAKSTVPGRTPSGIPSPGRGRRCEGPAETMIRTAGRESRPETHGRSPASLRGSADANKLRPRPVQASCKPPASVGGS
jgi:IS605 OrfB family transposase